MNAGILAVIAIVGRIITFVVSGTMAWDWVEPESFWGAIGFLIAWGLIGKIVDFVVVAIIAAIAGGLK